MRERQTEDVCVWVRFILPHFVGEPQLHVLASEGLSQQCHLDSAHWSVISGQRETHKTHNRYFYKQAYLSEMKIQPIPP